MKQELMRRYTELKSKVVSDRKVDFDLLIEHIENNTDFLNAPASTKFHLCCENGLLQHSVGVVETLIKMKDLLMPNISDESCVITGLFHDLGKAGFDNAPLYLKRQPSEKQIRAGYDAWPPYDYNKDLLYMSVPLRSIYHITRFIKLEPVEMQAIMYHDGQYVDDNKSVAAKEEPLTLLLQYADNWNGFVVEKGE